MTERYIGPWYMTPTPPCLKFLWNSLICTKGGRECLACSPARFQDQAYLAWFGPDVLYTVISQRNLEIGQCRLFGWILQIRCIFFFFCFIWRVLAKLGYSVIKTFLWSINMCTHARNYWSYIFWKKSISMIFGCEDCFTSLIWKYLS